MIHTKVIIFIFAVLCFNLSCQSNENTITNEEARLLCDKIEVMYTKGDTAIANEILDSTYVLYSPLFPLPQRSIEALLYNIQSNLRSFPDFQLTIDSLFVKDDIIYSFWTRKGTNTGPLGRMPTTGKSIDISGFAILKVRDKKIYEEHRYWNVLEFYKQLGFQIIPPKTEE
jgi:predicted ester cyclase